MIPLDLRAWDKTHNCMEEIHNLYWFEENGVETQGGFGHFGDCIIEQVTGLHDKNKRKIFQDSDILKATRFENEGKPYTLHFIDGAIRKHYACWPDGEYGAPVNQSEIDLLEDEIIGNIHENPELYK
jgi:uncharacterized phage protein (TIGR01671 family)